MQHLEQCLYSKQQLQVSLAWSQKDRVPEDLGCCWIRLAVSVRYEALLEQRSGGDMSQDAGWLALHGKHMCLGLLPPLFAQCLANACFGLQGEATIPCTDFNCEHEHYAASALLPGY